jgi:hypothetical protein
MAVLKVWPLLEVAVTLLAAMLGLTAFLTFLLRGV